MARISQHLIDRIKETTDLVSLCQSRGIELKKTGKNFTGRCPFHDDETASFVVNPSTKLFHCFGCGVGGDAIRLVEMTDKCSFRDAIEILTPNSTEAVKIKKRGSFLSEDSCLSTGFSLNRSKLLGLAADFYHATFNQRTDGRTYLSKRGITDAKLFTQYRIGLCSGTITTAIPDDGSIRDDLQSLGVIKSDDRAFFSGCVVFPIPDETGQIVNLSGRRIRDGSINHLYLPGPKVGIFNGQGLKSGAPIILVESILDALALIQAGYLGAIPTFGSAGIPPHILDALKTHSIQRVILCFDGDSAGRTATSKCRIQLDALGIDASIIHLPEGEDPCSLLNKPKGLSTFRTLFRGGHVRTSPSHSSTIKPEEIVSENGHLRVRFADRLYELSGLLAGGMPGRCKITIKVMTGDRFHLDTVDLISARSRGLFARSAAEIFGIRDAQVSSELLSLIDPIETYRRDAAQDEADDTPTMTEDQKAEALSFLTAPDLFDRILRDFETLGYTGEETNKLMGYLAAISRKLDDPLSVCIQSRSAAGKSSLQDAILNLVPPEDVVRYTRLTGQALFYKASDSLKHRILAVEEDVGAKDANYSIRAMQSSKEITIASAGRDPQTGKLRTEENRVEGPVVIFITTTEPDMDGETASRFLFLTIDESREATARIHAAQRSMRTLEGLMKRRRSDGIIEKHQNAQRLLDPELQVITPFAEHLDFKTDNIRTRRDHQKYLNLIDVIAYLHQHQRTIHTVEVDGEPLRYVEATLDDVRLANRLAAQVMGVSLDELAAPSRRLLDEIRAMVTEKAAEHGIQPDEFGFTRRDIREFTGWSDMQVKRYIHQLVDLEYLFSVTGGKGKQYIYELRLGDELAPGDKFLACLADVDALEKKLKREDAS